VPENDEGNGEKKAGKGRVTFRIHAHDLYKMNA